MNISLVCSMLFHHMNYKDKSAQNWFKDSRFVPNIKLAAVASAADDCRYFSKLPSAVEFHSALQNSSIKMTINFFQGDQMSSNKQASRYRILQSAIFCATNFKDREIWRTLDFCTRRDVPPWPMWQQRGSH